MNDIIPIIGKYFIQLKYTKFLNFVNQDKIHWKMLSENPNAIHLLEMNQDKINWMNLSRNSNAIQLLEKNIDKINWPWLSSNPNIFTYDNEQFEKLTILSKLFD